MNTFDEEAIHFDSNGLVPAVVQDMQSGAVLMLAYMNKDSIRKTLQTGETHFWSRSRQSLWRKGETSGNKQEVKSISLDCDGDAILVQVDQVGNACHTGGYSCFFNSLFESETGARGFGEVIGGLSRRIEERKKEMPEDSYTAQLFSDGLDRILKKIGEEAGETIIAAKNHDHKEIAWEVSDLLYHLLVLLVSEDVGLSEISAELDKRAAKKSKPIKK
jgi:phosphoribosyl-AMP cyclohydrolase / phosphoribosyl-ATP pyrophosphohydrolase